MTDLNPLPKGPPHARDVRELATSADLDLSTRIFLAERKVIDRDERVQLLGSAIVGSLRERVAQGIGGAVAALALLIGLRGFAPRRSAGLLNAVLPAKRSKPRKANPLWAHFVPLLWPLLPERIRLRMSPGTAVMVMGFAAPLLGRLVRPTPSVEPAPYVDLGRYSGRWYEVAKLPPNTRQAMCAANATQTWVAAGRDKLGIVDRCRLADGSEHVVRGVAIIDEPLSQSKLRVSYAPRWLRWLPWVWNDYWILHVEPDYSAALAGTPDRGDLRLLSRTPYLPEADVQRLVLLARRQGYDTGRLVTTPQLY